METDATIHRAELLVSLSKNKANKPLQQKTDFETGHIRLGKIRCFGTEEQVKN